MMCMNFMSVNICFKDFLSRGTYVLKVMLSNIQVTEYCLKICITRGFVQCEKERKKERRKRRKDMIQISVTSHLLG